ncbi:conserved hypothetical protein [Gammaproteobacteria bacterium]
MHTEKLSVSLPVPIIQFVEQYQKNHQCKNRAVVIKEALELLRQRELEQAYREASREVDPIWEVAIADGFDNETW